MKKEIQEFLDREFPKHDLSIESLGKFNCVLRKRVRPQDIRPGATISGPTMMGVADASVYVCIVFENGAIGAVTNQLSISFLRRPSGTQDILAHGRLVKLGKTLAVGQVELYSEGDEEMVALATVTYSLPKTGV